MTPLDQAHAAMLAASETDAARMAYFARLADAELFLVLEAEVRDDKATPQLFDTDDGRFVLLFDQEMRMSDFCGAVPYLAASGRQVAMMLAGQGVGLAVNPGAESAMLLPPEALGWLTDTLAHRPTQTDGRIAAVHRPDTVPEPLIKALDAKLASMAGLAETAYLASVDYAGGARTLAILFAGANPQAQSAIAGAVSEAVIFADAGDLALDVFFPEAEAAIWAAVTRHGLRFDLPEPERLQHHAPGSDPDTPPRLR